MRSSVALVLIALAAANGHFSLRGSAPRPNPVRTGAGIAASPTAAAALSTSGRWRLPRFPSHLALPAVSYAGLAGEPEPAPAEKSSAEPAAEAAASAPPPPSGESERDVAAAAVDEAEVRPSAPEAADDAETRGAESHVDANPDATGDEPASKRARGPEGGDLP